MVAKPLFIHQHNGNSACSLCSHDKSLLYVGSLRWPADERAEVVSVIHPDAVIGFVHVVDDVLPVEHYICRIWLITINQRINKNHLPISRIIINTANQK